MGFDLSLWMVRSGGEELPILTAGLARVLVGQQLRPWPDDPGRGDRSGAWCSVRLRIRPGSFSVGVGAGGAGVVDPSGVGDDQADHV